jgi:outer membrane protein assembly factor BamB
MPARLLQPAMVFAALAIGVGLAMSASALAASTAPLPPGPWTRTLEPNAPEPTVADVFRLPTPQAPLSEQALREWLTDVTATPRTFTFHPPSGATTIAGPSRLVPPLRQGTALRMLLRDPASLRIMAWSGNRAAVIETDAAARGLRWCGSVLLRPAPGRPAEQRWLASTSDGRAHRSGAGQRGFSGVLELRYLDGSIVLSRGEVRLVEVPLPAEPDEVLFDGDYSILGLELVRAAAPPPLPEPPPVTVAWRPAAIAWEGSGKAALEKRADGSVRLAQAAAQAPLVATWKLPSPEFGPREIVFEIDECGPGTGIYLASPEGQGGFVLGFVTPTPGGPADRQGLLLTTWSPADKAPLTGGDPTNLGLNFVPRRLWLRLIAFDQSVVICWSGDGRNWARPRSVPQLGGLGGIGTVGLFVSGHPGAAISLANLAAADLPGIARLLPRDLLPALNPALVSEGDRGRMAAWMAATMKAKPEGVDDARWVAAAAIRCLATNCTNLTAGLCAIVCRHARETGLPLAGQLAVCDDANRLAATLAGHDGESYSGVYGLVARPCVDRGDVAGYRMAWLRMQQAPCDIDPAGPQIPQSDPLGIRPRLVRRLIVTDPGGDLHGELARQRFYDHGVAYGYLELGFNAAGVAEPVSAGGAVVFDTDMPDQLAADEFEAAISSDRWEDAQRILARHVSDNEGRTATGLIRDPGDPERVVTLPQLAATAIRTRPGFRNFMWGLPADRGRLRLTNLQPAGDAGRMAGITLEFAGTPAAAEAREWLALRSLAVGEFVVAEEHAVAGLDGAAPATAGRLVSIRALAEALLGSRPAQQPAADLPGASAGEIAAVIAGASVPGAAREPPPEPSRPSDLEATQRLAFDAPPSVDGYSSHADSIRRERFFSPYQHEHRLDWGAEVCSLSCANGRLLANNRLELVSLDPATAAIQWRLPPGAKPGGLASLGPGLGAMRPCWDDRHAYLRRLAHGNAPTLVAVRLTDGTVAWESPPSAPWPPISDPVRVGGGLQFFEVRPGVIDELVFVIVDLASGARRGERVVCRLLSKWRVRRAKHDDKSAEAGDCQVTVADGRLYATIGGCVLCCQGDGRLRWARQLPWLAADTDDWWRFQAQTPPLVHDGRVFLMQPGFPGIAAVDAADGRLVWMKPLVGPRRLVGVAGTGESERLILETADGILACDPGDGSTRMLLTSRDGPGDPWLGFAPTRLVGPPVATADGQVVAMVQRRPAATAADQRPGVAVLWIDVATGVVQKTADVPALAGNPPWAGPLAVADGRLWTLAHAFAADMRRPLWELAPKPAP